MGRPREDVVAANNARLLVVDVEPVDLPLRVVAELRAVARDVLGRGVDAGLRLARRALPARAVCEHALDEDGVGQKRGMRTDGPDTLGEGAREVGVDDHHEVGEERCRRAVGRGHAHARVAPGARVGCQRGDVYSNAVSACLHPI